MMQYITKDQLAALGINLDGQDLDSLITHLNETIEERIGAEITEALNDAQLAELVKLQETASDEEIGTWIVAHVPNYQEIVSDNIDITIGELAESADGINQAI